MTESYVPVLRFPGFSNTWDVKKVSKITSKVSIPVNVKENEYYTQIGIRSHGKGIFHKESVTGESLGNKRVFWVKKDVLIINIVFAWEQAVAKTTASEVGMIASHRFPMYKPESEELDLDFILIFFLTKKGKSLLELASPGGAGRNKTLGQKEFDGLKIKLPSLSEQKKIASFLTAINAKIELLTKKKALLEQYKKGVMQQIFSQQIRFKDEGGNNFPEWQEKTLEELYSFKSTNSYSRENLNYESGEAKNIHYGDIHTKFKTLFDISREIVPYLNLNISVKNIPEENYCKEGDILFADASEDLNDVGKSIEIVNLNNDKVVAGLHTLLARLKSEKMYVGFGGYLFRSDYVRNQIQKESQGSKVLSISAKRLYNVKLLIPILSEQKKISSFLFVIDKKIDTLNIQIEELSGWQKGLIKRMFC